MQGAGPSFREMQFCTDRSYVFGRLAGPSFRDMQFCAGGGYFFGRLSDGFEASFCKFRRQR